MIGASINRLKATINNLTASSINTEVALGRMVNTDFALESQKLAKEQIGRRQGTWAYGGV